MDQTVVSKNAWTLHDSVTEVEVWIVRIQHSWRPFFCRVDVMAQLPGLHWITYLAHCFMKLPLNQRLFGSSYVLWHPSLCLRMGLYCAEAPVATLQSIDWHDTRTERSLCRMAAHAGKTDAFRRCRIRRPENPPIMMMYHVLHSQ